MLQHSPSPADRRITTSVVDLAIVVAVACCHLVLGQRARLVARNASGAA